MSTEKIIKNNKISDLFRSSLKTKLMGMKQKQKIIEIKISMFQRITNKDSGENTWILSKI